MEYEYNFSDTLDDPWIDNESEDKDLDKDWKYWVDLGLTVVERGDYVVRFFYLFRRKRNEEAKNQPK